MQRGSSISITPSLGSLLHPITSSANRDKLEAVRGTRTVQCCTVRSGFSSNWGNPGSPGTFRLLYAVRSHLPGSSRPDLSSRKLTAAWRIRSREDSSPVMEGSSVKLTPRACVNATVDLEAVPDYVPKADADVRLRTTDHTHRRPLAAFEVRRGLAEPMGLSGLRSGN